MVCTIGNVMARKQEVVLQNGETYNVTIKDTVKYKVYLTRGNKSNSYCYVWPSIWNFSDGDNDKYYYNSEGYWENFNSYSKRVLLDERGKLNFYDEVEIRWVDKGSVSINYNVDYYRYNSNLRGTVNGAVNFNIYDYVEIGSHEINYTSLDMANVTINLSHLGSNDLEYSINGGDTFQNSKEFLNVSAGQYTLQVRDKKTGYTHQKSITIRAIPPFELIAEISSTDCTGSSGSINLSLKGGSRYLIFNGNANIDFQNQLFVGEREFTVEGLFRIPTDADYAYMERQQYTGLFGQDNCIEMGFRSGYPAFYIYTSSGARSATSSTKLPNDGQWHHLALRSNCSNIELLLDGEVCATDNRSYSTLQSDDGLQGKPVSIGAKVWRDSGDEFKGHISNLSFWRKYLSNSEINNYKTNAPDGSESELLAAYNMNIRDKERLISVKGEEGDLNGCLWSDNCSYIWEDSSGAQVSVEEDITNLQEDDYTVTVNYTGLITSNLTTTYKVALINTLKVQVTAPDHHLCEGDELIITSNTAGGTGNYKYQWESFDGNAWIPMTGSVSSSYIQNQTFGNKNYRLQVNSGVCDTTSVHINLDVYKKIRTGRIRHVKN